MSNNLLFTELKLNGWRQFREIDIQFHDRLTVLTGANGAGKSTIIKLLQCHFPHEEDEKFLATPIQTETQTTFVFGAWANAAWRKLFRLDKKKEPEHSIGSIKYSNNKESILSLPEKSDMSYSLNRSHIENIDGISINSHRNLAKYAKVTSISVSQIAPRQALEEFTVMQKKYYTHDSYNKNGNWIKADTLGSLKETLIAFANFGTGNVNVPAVPELKGLYEKFQNILRLVLPVEVGFERLEIRMPEVIVVSSSGDFPIDGASGGLMSIIQLSWQMFLQSVSADGRFAVLIDEPENHLHPSLQRSFLNNLVNAFPSAQFIVATHSPFIISSVKESFVYALRHYNSEGNKFKALEPRSVNSEKLDQIQKAGPANEILKEVLGVPVTIPDWSATTLQDIASQFSKRELSKETLMELRHRLDEAGLSEFYPETVAKMVQ